MRLSSQYRKLLIEKKKIKYAMKNANGGFSSGIEIKPSSESGKMDVVVNIYGGSQNNAVSYPVPPTIKEFQDALVAARQSGDVVSIEIKDKLEKYYADLNRAISLEVVNLMQQFDQGIQTAIQNAIAKYNAKLQ